MLYRKQNPFFLAPMAGVTDRPFRSFMREMGCGIICSELISARALMDNNQATQRLADFSLDQKPFGIQIFGEDPEILAEGAKQAESSGVDFIDLNLGCPVNKIVKKGAGSALLKDLKALTRVLRSLRANVKIPLTLKVRTGWDGQSRNADQVARMAFEEGFSWMSLHGRTRAQGYSGHADWHYIKRIKSHAPLPIIGNGDIKTGRQAVQALEQSACDGVMIGRACLSNPWIFMEALNLLEAGRGLSRPTTAFENEGIKTKRESLMPTQDLKFLPAAFDKGDFRSKKASSPHKRELPARQDMIFEKDFKAVLNKLKAHLEAFYDERMFVIQMKKFSAWFSSGFPHSTAFRKAVFQEKDRRVLFEKIEDFFSALPCSEKPRPSAYEPFLMRGHG